LPRVRYWQIWNEPNLTTYLAPQWTRRAGHYVPTSPSIYRDLLNAGYTALKQVAPTNLVVEAGTAPYGDLSPRGGRRMPPVAFARSLYCLSAHLTRTCRGSVHFDIASHHPYAVAGPQRPALNADDAAIPDYRKLVRLVRRGVQIGSIRPHKPKRYWVTELSWDSKPPDPYGVPEATQARWLSEAFYLLWRQGVDTVVWLQIVDAPPEPSFATTYQGGVYLLNGQPKPAATAIRFPFIAQRTHGKIRYWLRAPTTATVSIQTKVGAKWRSVIRRRAEAGQVVTGVVSDVPGDLARAEVGGQRSLDWRVTR
jgi:hypothetical protein